MGRAIGTTVKHSVQQIFKGSIRKHHQEIFLKTESEKKSGKKSWDRPRPWGVLSFQNFPYITGNGILIPVYPPIVIIC
jgi:hypothetical protein